MRHWFAYHLLAVADLVVVLLIAEPATTANLTQPARHRGRSGTSEPTTANQRGRQLAELSSAIVTPHAKLTRAACQCAGDQPGPSPVPVATPRALTHEPHAAACSHETTVG